MIELGYGVLFALGLVVLNDGQRRQASARIREALRLADLSLSQAAAWMHLDPSDVTRGLSGERPLNAWRLEMLPDAYHQHHALLELRDRGLPEYAKTAVKISPAVEEKKEGAK